MVDIFVQIVIGIEKLGGLATVIVEYTGPIVHPMVSSGKEKLVARLSPKRISILVIGANPEFPKCETLSEVFFRLFLKRAVFVAFEGQLGLFGIFRVVFQCQTVKPCSISTKSPSAVCSFQYPTIRPAKVAIFMTRNIISHLNTGHSHFLIIFAVPTF